MATSVDSKRTYSQRESSNDDYNTNGAHPPPKRYKPQIALESISPPSTSSVHSKPPTRSISNSVSINSSVSAPSASSFHSSRSNDSGLSNQTPSSRKRKDLYDPILDEQYANTKPTSTIPPPTLGNAALEKVWREKTDRALQSFQRRAKTHEELVLEQEPNNEIMKILLRESVLVTDQTTLIRLQECVLNLVYSNQQQQRQLMRSKNRRKRFNNNNNQDQNRPHRYDISWYEKLPGPQPHSITRQNLDRLRSYYYWVTEKSDGIRFMMLLSNAHPLFEAYFVGRKFEFYRIKHPFYKQFLNNVSGPSLLDGELIINSEQRLEYLAFDCVAIGGKSLSNEVTNTRVERVAEFHTKYLHDIADYPEIERKKEREYVEPPIILRAKRHYKAGEIGSLLDKISCDEEGEYYFDDGVRRTKNDGLIFTPQENNFLMSYDPGALVKWKFLEKNTIDLKVKMPYVFRDELDLYAGGKGQSDVLFAKVNMESAANRRQFELLHEEMQRLSRYRHGFVPSFIVECAWNFETFQWDLVQNRPDKHIPNFITVCTDTLRVMMDNVTEQELVEACNLMVEARPSMDHYPQNYHHDGNGHHNDYRGGPPPQGNYQNHGNGGYR